MRRTQPITTGQTFRRCYDGGKVNNSNMMLLFSNLESIEMTTEKYSRQEILFMLLLYTMYHCSNWTWVVEDILDYGNRLRSTH